MCNVLNISQGTLKCFGAVEARLQLLILIHLKISTVLPFLSGLNWFLKTCFRLSLVSSVALSSLLVLILSMSQLSTICLSTSPLIFLPRYSHSLLISPKQFCDGDTKFYPLACLINYRLLNFSSVLVFKVLQL